MSNIKDFENPTQAHSLEIRDLKRDVLFQNWKRAKKPYSDFQNSYLQRQSQFESNARSYPRRFPIAIRRSKHMFVEDTDGRIFLDCLSGAGSLALGHNNSVVKEAMLKLVNSESPLLTLDITTPIKDEFVKVLMDCLPEDFRKGAKIQFCSPSGADAIEAAIKLAKTVTGRGSIFCFSGGYHGMTNGAMAVTGNRTIKEPIRNLMKDVHFMPFPYHFRCPFGIGGTKAENLSLHYIENLLEDEHSGISKPAAFLLEIVQGEGGNIPASNYWVQGIRRITKKYNIPLIIDEVQTGIGRTGTMFAFEPSGIKPDILVISKAIGGGLPLSLILYDQTLDKWKPGAHTGTFRGNQMAMSAGTAVLKYMKENKTLRNVTHISDYLLNELRQFENEYDFIGEVRGRGLMLGIEIIETESGTQSLWMNKANGTLAKLIQHKCLQHGLILETGGRSDCVLRLLPPLNIILQEAKAVIGVLNLALQEVTSKVVLEH